MKQPVLLPLLLVLALAAWPGCAAPADRPTGANESLARGAIISIPAPVAPAGLQLRGQIDPARNAFTLTLRNVGDAPGNYYVSLNAFHLYARLDGGKLISKSDFHDPWSAAWTDAPAGAPAGKDWNSQDVAHLNTGEERTIGPYPLPEVFVEDWGPHRQWRVVKPPTTSGPTTASAPAADSPFAGSSGREVTTFVTYDCTGGFYDSQGRLADMGNVRQGVVEQPIGKVMLEVGEP